jgi:tRNA pseudouridine55 synthase
LTDASGLVVVDKPAGWTSHQVVGRCRRLLGTKKVGHAGTLDPMATGVLLVGVNRATRLLGHLAGHDKTYTATIRLGQATVTDDAEGEVVEAAGAGGVTEADVRTAVTAFVGRISQVPSSVSAIKVAGKRAYAMVRAGEEVELRPREVTVSRFDVLNVRAASAAPLAEPSARPLAEPTAQPLIELASAASRRVELPVLDVDVEVDCSSGTYIRALARDLGRALDCGGHLTALRRTRVGGFDLSLVGLDAAGLAGDAPPKLIGLAEVARRGFPVVEVTPAQATDVGFGRPLDLPVPADPTALLAGEQLLALYRPAGDGRSAPVAVLV